MATILTIHEMHSIAKERKGQCLSHRYANCETKLLWQCSKGHKWDASPNSIKRGNWCPECGRIQSGQKKRTGIDWFKDYAISKGGQCLSNSMKTINSSRLKFRCKNDHEWETSAHSAKYGAWCTQCYHDGRIGKYSYGIDTFQDIAKSHGGKCISEVFKGINNKLMFQCSEGHSFKNGASNIKRGQWCPKCANKKRGETRRDSIDDLVKIIEGKGGQCLSNQYENQNTLLKVKCANDHEWTAPAKRIKRGDWCIMCSHSAPMDIAIFEKLVIERGGELLEKVAKGAHVPLKAKCYYGHFFKISFPNARAGKWCPYCNQSIGERTCRYAFESLFKKEFPIANPRWLMNPQSGKPLQLDGYCEELKLAFEHQGLQHYKPMTIFGGEKGFKMLVARDKLKEKRCKEKNILLITIPELYLKTPIENLKELIRGKCEENNFPLPKWFDQTTIDFNKVYFLNRSEEYKQQIRIFLAKHKPGAKLITKTMPRADCSITLLCEKGHKFKSVKSKVLSGHTWCQICSGRKYTEQDYVLLGKRHGLIFIPPISEFKRENARWKCKNNHIFERPFTTLNAKDSRGRCDICYSQKFKAENIAEKYGGMFLGKHGVDSYNFECKKQHKFRKKLFDIRKNNIFCPFCGI